MSSYRKTVWPNGRTLVSKGTEIPMAIHLKRVASMTRRMRAKATAEKWGLTLDWRTNPTEPTKE